MEKPKSRARFPARMTVQVTQELRYRLQELARREYGGDLQALLRETLQARVDEPGDDQAEMAEVLRALGQIREEAAERLDRLQDVTMEMSGALSRQGTDTMGILDRLEKIRGEMGILDRAEKIRGELSGALSRQGTDTMDILDRLEEIGGEMSGALSRQGTDTMGILDRAEEIRGELSGALSRQLTNTKDILDRVEKIRGELAEMDRPGLA